MQKIAKREKATTGVDDNSVGSKKRGEQTKEGGDDGWPIDGRGTIRFYRLCKETKKETTHGMKEIECIPAHECLDEEEDAEEMRSFRNGSREEGTAVCE